MESPGGGYPFVAVKGYQGTDVDGDLDP